MASYQIRFRHTQGDIGPFSFGLGASVDDLKQKLLAEWPTGERWNRAAGETWMFNATQCC